LEASRALEVSFLLVSLTTLIVSMYSLHEAIVDETWLTTRDNNGPRKVIADGNVREEGFKVGMSAVMVGASVLALIMAPPPPNYSQLPQSLTFLIAWITVGVLMITSSAFGRIVRRKLYKYSEELNAINQTRRSTDVEQTRRKEDTGSHEH
jgi:hypothetical protein